jgi:hypothetical protein
MSVMINWSIVYAYAKHQNEVLWEAPASYTGKLQNLNTRKYEKAFKMAN